MRIGYFHFMNSLTIRFYIRAHNETITTNITGVDIFQSTPVMYLLITITICIFHTYNY